MEFDSNLFRSLCPFIRNITKEFPSDPDIWSELRALTHLLKLSYINIIVVQLILVLGRGYKWCYQQYNEEKKNVKNLKLSS